MSLLDIFKVSQYKAEIQRLNDQTNEMQAKLDELHYSDYEAVKKHIEKLSKEIKNKEEEIDNLNRETGYAQYQYSTLEQELKEKTATLEKEIGARVDELNEQSDNAEKRLKTAKNKLAKSRELYKSITHAIEYFFNYVPELEALKLSAADSEELDVLSPSVELKLHHMDVKNLRKAFRDNDKQIETVLEQYSKRYTTKANKAIYELMVVALRAELQNILYNLKYDKLDNGIDQVKNLTQRYLNIAATGNQLIAGTLTKFIGEIEYLFINAVKIEYNYYVKKEQARQQQLAIREQMRQEAEERKALERERKKIENEELKYTNEIEKLKAQAESSGADEVLTARILELEAMLADVVVKKQNIVDLQNGKAGNVYIISNLGSFGENVFKIGMTRRINPQERVDELGSASVPFKFDVHSFIFSEDAVGLESKLHSILNDKRLNKVNLRKEFFTVDIDELEGIVNEIDPTAEFNRTMLAEEFRQSLSSDENYTDEIVEDEEEDN